MDHDPGSAHGTFALVLHSHIPYCRKSGVWPAGEEWLFEAMLETYLPLLAVMRDWQRDGVPGRLTIGVVPVLAEQLADDYMRRRFDEYLDDKLERAERDAGRFAHDPRRARVACYFRERFQHLRDVWRDAFGRDVLGALRGFQDAGTCEVITSGATHGFLPLLARDSSVRAQIQVGVDTYRRHFGRNPRGFWLPECAYRPAEWSATEQRDRASLDSWLAAAGIEYFFVEGVGLTRASFPAPARHGEAAPDTHRGYRLASGVVAYGRDQATGRQVWSPDGGYPGDFAYLEFHCKDAESGLRYHRVTGAPDKDVYDPDQARARAHDHARHFVWLLEQETARAAAAGIADPVIVAPYDAELFGHWWHEGVDWIDRVYRELAARRGGVRPASVGDHLDRHRDELSTVAMAPSTWGQNADFTVWQNPEHGWIWPLINDCARNAEQALGDMAARGLPRDERGRRVVRQLCRELLLMQGSDWPFLLFTQQAKDYANQRFHHHHQRFLKLLWAAKDLDQPERISVPELAAMEDVDCPWPELDPALFRS